MLYLRHPSHSKDSFAAELINVQELPQGIAWVGALDDTVGGAKATVAEKNDRSRAQGVTRDNVGHAQVSFTILWSDGEKVIANRHPFRLQWQSPQDKDCAAAL